MMKNIAVFASGTGSNFQAIVREVNAGRLRCRLSLLVCDNPRAGVMARARKAGVPVMLIERDRFADRQSFEQAILARLAADKIELIVLAGFMRILSPAFIKAYPNRIINIHPALLPAFKGGQSIRDAFAYGVKVTGVTVHFVDEQTDHGPIILQQAVPLRPADTLASLETRIHRVEHTLYPRAIKLVLSGKTKVAGRIVRLI